MIRFKIVIGLSILLLIIITVWNLFFGISSIWYLIPITFLFLSIVIGSFSMSYNLFLNAFTKQPKAKQKLVALTFDDGPNAQYTPKVLELLSKFNAKATFFCIGKYIDNHPEILKSINDAGHTIGNHSYSHHNLIGFSTKTKWLEEINKTDDLIKKITTKRPTLFRPPFGITTPHLAKAIEISAHKVIGWDIRSFDTTIKNPNDVLERIYKRVKPGSIVLLHDTHNRIPFILEHLLSYLKKHDYKAVTIETLIDEISI